MLTRSSPLWASLRRWARVVIWPIMALGGHVRGAGLVNFNCQGAGRGPTAGQPLGCWRAVAVVLLW
jgi:hypothetical protein